MTTFLTLVSACFKKDLFEIEEEGNVMWDYPDDFIAEDEGEDDQWT
jgi:hypothetical protein